MKKVLFYTSVILFSMSAFSGQVIPDTTLVLVNIYESWYKGKWKIMSKEEFGYDNQNRKIFSNLNAWDPTLKTLWNYGYDSTKSEVVYIMKDDYHNWTAYGKDSLLDHTFNDTLIKYQYSDTGWYRTFREITVYTSSGLKEEIVTSHWWQDTWTDQYRKRFWYNYHDQQTSYTVEEWNEDSQTWVNNYKECTAYNCYGKVDKIKNYTWDIIQYTWKPICESNYRYFRKCNKFITEKIEQGCISVIPENQKKSYDTTNIEGKLIGSEEYNWVNGSWEPYRQTKYVYDFMGNLLIKLHRMYRVDTGWYDVERYHYVYAYLMKSRSE